MILVTTAGRDYDFTSRDYWILNALNPTWLFVGDARGGDACVWAWAENNVHKDKRLCFIADWTRLGKGAGPERNDRMLRHALQVASKYSLREPLLLAFPGGKGTWNCIGKARSYGIPVIHADSTIVGTIPEMRGT